MRQSIGSVHVMIPARLASTRLPRKLLLPDQNGVPIIKRVFETCVEFAEDVRKTFHVAADSKIVCPYSDFDEIYSVVQDWRISCSGTNHENGTSRIAEELFKRTKHEGYSAMDVVVHVQADEAGITKDHLWAVLKKFLEFPVCDVATLATHEAVAPFWDDQKSCVKVVMTGDIVQMFTRRPCNGEGQRHIGVYVYRPQHTFWHASLKGQPGDSLEQSVAMRNGARYKAAFVRSDSIPRAIDTQEDYEDFLKWQERDENGKLVIKQPHRIDEEKLIPEFLDKSSIPVFDHKVTIPREERDDRVLVAKCPKCDSPQPKLHPAVQFEGEVEICDHDFHKSIKPSIVKKPLDNSYDRYCSCCQMNRIHRHNTLGICPDCSADLYAQSRKGC